jgi:DNA uptake protein ComE-like DNA-binding protein
LKKSYSLKFEILDELIAKLLKNEKTDIASELKLANSYTENKYNSRTDIEVDQQLDQFLKLLADEVEKADEVDQKQVLEPITIEKEVQPVVVTQLAEPKPKKTFY